MKVIDLYMTYKNDYQSHIVMIKIGNFYELYNIDAYILSKIMNYKLKNESNYMKVGFPIISLNKVTEKLDNLRINYIVIEKEEIYIIKTNKKFKNNNYKEYYLNSNNIKNINDRIDIICNYLKNYDKDKINNLLTKIEGLYE